MDKTKRTILGIHCGHDASVSVVDESGLRVQILQERHSRIRHDVGINYQTIQLALDTLDLSLDDISRVDITSTQLMPGMIQSPEEIEISTRSKLNPDKDLAWLHGREWVKEAEELIIDDLSFSELPPEYREYVETFLVAERKIPSEIITNSRFLRFNDPLRVKKYLSKNRTLKTGAEQALKGIHLEPWTRQSAMDLGLPITTTIQGRQFEGKFWSHHATHAASNLSISSKSRLIFTHDGGVGFQSGGLWKFHRGNLNLLLLHELELGQFYDFVADQLGLGKVGGAGKLMGLAAYGAGKEPPQNLIGNINDWKKSLNLPISSESKVVYEKLYNEILSIVKNQGLDTSLIGNPLRVTEAAPAQVAWITQAIVESSLLKFVQLISKFRKKHLGMSGGFALNCPSNSLVAEFISPRSVLVEPHCEDGGCSAGAAFLGFKDLTGNFPKIQRSKRLPSAHAFKSAATDDKVIVGNFSKAYQGTGNIDFEIAQLIAKNKIVGLFYMNSEIGPRALGHRSIIANPAFASNWERVNKIKSRERWRPFAPAVLEEDLGKYFSSVPKYSPFMLFNYKVKPEYQSLLSAITHKDGTSRVQTVDTENMPLRNILNELSKMGLPTVVLNTSFNGPGEPIIQTIEEAFNFFNSTDLDALRIGESLFLKATLEE